MRAFPYRVISVWFLLLVFPGCLGLKMDGASTLLSGQGALSPMSYDFGIQPMGGTTSWTFKLTNTSQSSFDSISISGISAPFSLSPGGCGSSLDSGSSCNFIVVYSPVSIGSTSQSWVINFQLNGQSETITVPLSGTSVTPGQLIASDSPMFNFGDITVSMSEPHTFTFTNTGGTSVTDVTPGTSPSSPFSLQSSTCEGSLAPNATCDVTVVFQPQEAGLVQSSIAVNYTAGSQSSTVSRSMTGTGVLPTALSISDGPLFDFGSVTAGTTSTHLFTLSNPGTVDAINLMSNQQIVAPFSFAGTNSFPGAGGNCASVLSAGMSCQFAVTFAPSAVGSFNDTISISYQVGDVIQTVTRQTTGTGALPTALTISGSPSFSFGTVGVGQTFIQTFTISNMSQIAASNLSPTSATPTAPFTYVGGSFPGGGSCTSTLKAQSSCTVLVSFSPTASSSFSSQIQMSYSYAGTPQILSLPLSGVGAASNLISLNPASYNFGNQNPGATATQSFTLTNTSASVTLTNLTGTSSLAAVYFAGSFPGGGNANCTSTLLPMQSCIVQVTFLPEIESTYSTNILITALAGAVAQQTTLAVSGTGRYSTAVAYSGSGAFGAVEIGTTSPMLTLTLTNRDTAALTNFSQNPALSAPYSIEGGSCVGINSLGGGSSCTVEVTFTPSSGGQSTENLTYTYLRAGVTESASFSLTGSGVGVIGANPNPVVFNPTLIGSTNSQLITLTNPTSANITGLDQSTIQGPYAFPGGTFPGGGTCANILTPGASCTAQVSFLPVASGLVAGTLVINYAINNANLTYNVSLQGVGEAPATLVVTGGVLPFNFSNTTIGTSKLQVFTVQNTGGVTATNVSLTSPASGFSASINCNSASPTGNGCQLSVGFAPSLVQAYSSVFSLNYFDGRQNQTMAISVAGQGVNVNPSVTISGSDPVDFGSIAYGSTHELSFTLANNGSVALTGLQPGYPALANGFQYVGGAYPGEARTSSCGATLNAGQSCTMTILMTPININNSAQTVFSSIYLNYSAGGTPGLATRMLQAEVGPASVLDFGPFSKMTTPADVGITVAVGGHVDTMLTVYNEGGNQPASNIIVAFSGPFTFAGNGSFPGGGTCATVVNGGATCTLGIRFSPTVVGLGQTGTISLSWFNGLTVASSVLNLIGDAVAPGSISSDLVISRGPFQADFGFPAMGSSSTLSFQLTNSTTQPINGIAPIGFSSSSSFQFVGMVYPGGGTCGPQLAAGASCTVSLVYTPKTTNLETDTLQIGYTSMNGTQTASRPLQGSGETGQPHGSLDLAFNTTGTYVSEFTSNPEVVNWAIPIFTLTQPDGKVVAVVDQRGYEGQPGTTVPNILNLLGVRFLRNGTLDPTFGNGGVVNFTGFPVDSNYGTVSLQPDGKLIFQSGEVIFRTDWRGNTDLSFTSSARVDLYTQTMSLPNGQILAMGTNSGVLTLWRLNSNGSTDTTFGTSGILNLIASAYPTGSTNFAGYAVQPDGKLLLLGSVDVDNSAPIIVVRLNSDFQTLDTTFGTNGVATLPLGGGALYPMSVAVNSVGGIFIGGGEGDPNFPNQLILKLTPSGSLDNTFNGTGYVLGNLGDVRFINILPTGYLQLIGRQSSYTGGIMQLTPQGALDVTFGNNGVVAPTGLEQPLGNTYVDGKLMLLGDIGLNISDTYDASFSRFWQ